MRFISFLMLGLITALVMPGCSDSSTTQTPNSKTITHTDRAPVDAAIRAAVEKGAFPFLYVRVEDLDGNLVYEQNAMSPDFAPTPPTGESWMRLWSMSKSVTIATILALEEDGVLDRNDPVTDYIPEFDKLRVLKSDIQNPSCETDLRPPSRAMTIEDLLNHNDGFYYPFTEHDCLNDALSTARLPEASSSQDLIDRIATLPLHPGGIGDHQYGIGTTILGLVAERATRKSFDQIVREKITVPLGISNMLKYRLPEGETTYPRVTGASGALEYAEPEALDIFGGPVPEYEEDLNIFLGGEGMVGTTKGYATFLRAMGNQGELNGTRILNAETVRDWSAPKTQLDSPYGQNGFNIWVTSGKFDGLPDQKPGLLVGGGYEGTAFWIDMDAGYVGLIMSQVHSPALQGTDEVSRIRGLIYSHILEPGVAH